MASSTGHSKKQFKKSMSKKSHSWWWDSHNCPKNSKWLAENLEKMDDSVNRMLKLIEEDADSFAKKAQMYYQKRPELVHLVEEFYRMYRALAERYDHASGELKKNLPLDIQSQVSLELSSPTSLEKSSHHHKEDEDSLSLTDSDSDSNDEENGDEALIQRLAELELELQETKQMLLVQQERVNSDEENKNEKMRNYEEEIANLKIELHSCMPSGAEENLPSLQHELELAQKEIDKLNAEKREVVKVQERLAMVKTSLQDRDNEIRGLRTAVSDAEEKIFPEKAEMKGEMSKLSEERNKLGEQVREMESYVRLIIEEKGGMEEKLRVMREDIVKREEKVKEMEKHMKELHVEQVRLRRRSSELGDEVERKRVDACDVAEQKREAIRQLCASLDYYKDEYERLWKVVVGHKRGVVIAS